jgi:ribosome-associated protein
MTRRTESRTVHGQSRRPAHGETAAPPAPASDDNCEAVARPSRSARKRQALALQALGVRLTALRPAQLADLALPEELLAAVLEAQRLRSRAAIARQRQYIGRLMRALDPAPIEQALAQRRRPE